jgi:iron complex outermembrane receptor protein
MKNLADVKREYVWYDETFGATAQPFFSPGDGRAVYGAVNVKYDF